jgi:hypothetical protein
MVFFVIPLSPMNIFLSSPKRRPHPGNKSVDLLIWKIYDIFVSP